MILKLFCEKLKDKIIFLYKDIPSEKIEILINTDQKKIGFGDLSTNAPMIIAKSKKKNPFFIAEELRRDLCFEEILKIEIGGGGFLNFFFTDSFFQKSLRIFQDEKSFYTKKNYPKDCYNIEYVSANPTGPLHIGHGRGAIIGDILAKVFKLKGYSVIREFYINDAGSQIEKLGLSVCAAYKNLCGQETVIPEDGYHGYYIKEIAEKIFLEYEDTLCDKEIGFFSAYAEKLLLENIKNTLSEYQVIFDSWFSEKNLHKGLMIDRAIQLLDEKGFILKTEDGALWFKSTLFGDEKDRVLKKKTGEWTYTAADIAYFLNKIDRGFTKIIMVLGQDHHSFKIRLEAIAKAFSFNVSNLEIILYQLVTLKNEGELFRMSKRKGNSVELGAVIDTVGSDVARFFYLNKKADAHLEFDIKEALEKNVNNPVFYIQYALVRIKSIFQKAGLFIDLNILQDDIESQNLFLFSDIEKLLLKQIGSLDNTLDKILIYYSPHLITYFTLELVSLFHAWYNSEHIIDQKNLKEMKKKLLILRSVDECLKICVMLLGVQIPDKM